MPDTGDHAPDFQSVDTDGNPIALSDFRGRPVVLYFYPKDDTPGCTKEACGFRDQLPNFEAVDAEVLGVSRDSAASHRKFADKYELPFRLVADEDESVCQAYDVLKEKNMYGRKSIGIERTTYLIDAEGVIRRKWKRVKVDGHVDEVLEAVKGL